MIGGFILFVVMTPLHALVVTMRKMSYPGRETLRGDYRLPAGCRRPSILRPRKPYDLNCLYPRVVGRRCGRGASGPPRAEGTIATFTFSAVTRTSTRVVLLQTGSKSGSEWDAAYEYLSKGNVQIMEQLHARFARGPMKWPQ